MPSRQNQVTTKGYSVEGTDGSLAPVAPADHGRLRYDEVAQEWQGSINTGPYLPVLFGTQAWTRVLLSGSAVLGTATQHQVVFVDSPVDSVIVLPDATLDLGYLTTVVRVGSGRVLVMPGTGQAVSGDSDGLLLAEQYASAGFFSDASNWFALMLSTPATSQTNELLSDQATLLRLALVQLRRINLHLGLGSGLPTEDC